VGTTDCLPSLIFSSFPILIPHAFPFSFLNQHTTTTKNSKHHNFITQREGVSSSSLNLIGFVSKLSHRRWGLSYPTSINPWLGLLRIDSPSTTSFNSSPFQKLASFVQWQCQRRELHYGCHELLVNFFSPLTSFSHLHEPYIFWFHRRTRSSLVRIVA